MNGLSWTSPTRAFWRASKRFTRRGYTPARIRLPGGQGDGMDDQRAALCAEYQAAAEAWLAARTEASPTWAGLIESYRLDEFSPMQSVKGNTRQSYEWLIRRWEDVLDGEIAAMDYHAIRSIERDMRAAGGSDSHVHKMFRALRDLTSYGKMIRSPGAAEVSALLSEIRFKTPPPRSVAPTRAQIRSIIAEADAQGLHAFACGLLIQYELTLRAVDVFGQWVAGAGGINRNGKRWQDGLTWDMVEPGFRGFSKVISKTARSMPYAIRFGLEDLPEVRSRLRLLYGKGRTGPVIVTAAHRLPYTIFGRSQTFRRLADAVGATDITMMDLRAGAVTEAKNLGADPMAMRDAAQHANISTTSRYARDRDTNVANVVRLRQS